MGASGCFFFSSGVGGDAERRPQSTVGFSSIGLVSSETRYLRKTQARKSCPGQVSHFISRPLVLPPQI